MRRKRRRIQYYNAEPTRERLRDKPWLPFAVIVVTALILALVIGAILGNIAERSRRKGVNYGDLSEFGGVETAPSLYAALYPMRADFVAHTGMDADALADAIDELPDGNAVGVWLYDGRGGVFFDAALADKLNDLTIRASIGSNEIAEVASDASRYSVGYFVTGAFSETDEQLRLMTEAREMALLTELASSGLGEIVILGLPDDIDAVEAVQSYARRADAAVGEVRLGVAASAESESVARLVAATEGYADSYYLDARTLSGEALGKAVTDNAYFLTYYNMRLMLSDSDRETALGVVDGFGITGCQLMPAGAPRGG